MKNIIKWIAFPIIGFVMGIVICCLVNVQFFFWLLLSGEITNYASGRGWGGLITLLYSLPLQMFGLFIVIWLLFFLPANALGGVVLILLSGNKKRGGIRGAITGVAAFGVCILCFFWASGILQGRFPMDLIIISTTISTGVTEIILFGFAGKVATQIHSAIETRGLIHQKP
jgi:hypothetical protein